MEGGGDALSPDVDVIEAVEDEEASSVVLEEAAAATAAVAATAGSISTGGDVVVLRRDSEGEVQAAEEEEEETKALCSPLGSRRRGARGGSLTAAEWIHPLPLRTLGGWLMRVGCALVATANATTRSVGATRASATGMGAAADAEADATTGTCVRGEDDKRDT